MQPYGRMNQCVRSCVDLTALDPAAAGNPELRIRFGLAATANSSGLSKITVSGPPSCDASTLGLIGVLPVEASGGSYRVPLVNGRPGRPLHGRIQCNWTGGATEPSLGADFAFTE